MFRKYLFRNIINISLIFSLLLPSMVMGYNKEPTINPYIELKERYEKQLNNQNDTFDKDLADDFNKKDVKKHQRVQFPTKVKTRSRSLLLSNKSLQKLSFLSHIISPNNTIKLNELGNNTLLNLSSEELEILLNELNHTYIKIKCYNKGGRVHSKKNLINKISSWNGTEVTVTVFLVLKVAASKDKNLLAKMIAASPDAIMFGLKGNMASILQVDVVADVLIKILQKVTTSNTIQIASSAENVGQVYIKYWAKSSSEELIWALTRLIIEVLKLSDLQKVPLTLKQKGILLGVLLAGAIMHSNKITSRDERRLWIINSISNLVWATTGLIGIFPIAGDIVAGVSSVINISVVVWAVAYNKIGTRNFTPKIREIEGYIEMYALDAAQESGEKAKIVETLELLAWMHASFHVNGLSD